jgi:hypothetical protein
MYGALCKKSIAGALPLSRTSSVQTSFFSSIRGEEEEEGEKAISYTKWGNLLERERERKKVGEEKRRRRHTCQFLKGGKCLGVSCGILKAIIIRRV